MNDIVSRRSVDGTVRLALRFPAASLKGAGSALTAAMNEEGRLLPDGGGPSAPWRFDSVQQDGESGFLLGPDFEGRSLEEAGGAEDGLGLLLAVARALATLASESALPRGLASPGILVAPSGQVLVLPPGAAAKALSAGGAQAAAVARLPSSGSAASESDASLFLALAAYRLASGLGAAASGRDRIATGLVAPRLDPALAALVDRALADPASVPLGDWVAALEAAGAAGWTRELPAAEGELLAKRRSSLEAEVLARARRGLFLRRRGGILAAAAAGLVVLALAAGDILRASADKPDFSYMSPRELVGRYYQAIDDMDLDALEACGAKAAIKADSSLLVNFVVISKTRMAYEGRSPVLKAGEWIARGKGELVGRDLLFGVTGLSLRGGEAYASATSVAIRAEYSFWMPERKDDPSGDLDKSTTIPVEERRVDLLTVERGGKGWRITGLERTLLP